jgi:signal transduction histidine kinase
LNENHSHFLDRKYKLDNWKSWPPEVFLAVLLHELRNPIYVIKGWTEFLSQEGTKEHLPDALKSISHSIEKLEDAYQGIADYYQGLQSKS